MYKEGDYLIFMSKQPDVHLNRMFGHNSLTSDEFEKELYIGVVKKDLGGLYVVTTVSPLQGFRCMVREDDILRQADASELALDQRTHEAPEP